jgi:hypothetical protein
MPVYIGTTIPPQKNRTQIEVNTRKVFDINGIGKPMKAQIKLIKVTNIIDFLD